MWTMLHAEWHEAVVFKQMYRCWCSIREIYCKRYCIWQIYTVSFYDCDLLWLKCLGYNVVSFWALEKDIWQV